MKTINEQIIAKANELIALANSEAHLTDKGCILHFIADDLKLIGNDEMKEHQEQIDKIKPVLVS